jgi:hypothetical protein
LEFGVLGLWFRIYNDLGFADLGLEIKVHSLGFKVQSLGVPVQGVRLPLYGRRRRVYHGGLKV